jgi:DNA-binding MarR family transcriptional regulator
MSLPDSERPAAPGSPRPGPAIDYGLLSQLIGYNLRRALAAVSVDFHVAMAPFEATPGQFGVLMLIRENAGLSQSELGAALGIDRSTMVAVIDRLQARGLVVRAVSPRDRRSYALQLSAAGDALVERMIPQVRALETTIAAGLSDEERVLLIDLLSRIAGQRHARTADYSATARRLPA